MAKGRKLNKGFLHFIHVISINVAVRRISMIPCSDISHDNCILVFTYED